MEGPRPLHEHELNDFVRFLSSQLRPNQDWSIAEEYPLALQDANLNNVRVIRDEKGFLSAALMKPLILKTPVGLLKVAAIGSVVTSPEHRNQGLSRQVLDDLIEAGRAHGCELAILWTNLFDFYRKLGFELAGSEISLALPATFKAPASTERLRFLQSEKIDAEALLRLYSQHTTGSLRTVEEIRKFLRIPNARVYSAWDELNRLQAYAVEGKGADLDGYIHEWGGGVSKLLPLLEFMVEKSKKDLTLIAPQNAGNLIRQLTAQGAKQHQGVLGMIKILNADNFLRKIKKYLRGMGHEHVILERRDGQFYLGYDQSVFRTDSESDIIRLIFGPQKAAKIHPFDAPTVEVFEKVFPIPMWIWGWDSV